MFFLAKFGLVKEESKILLPDNRKRLENSQYVGKPKYGDCFSIWGTTPKGKNPAR